MKRIIGLDYGKKRIGIAVSDPLGITAQPVDTIENSKNCLQKIKEIVDKYESGLVVVGLPKNLKGEIAQAAEEVLCFVRKLQKVLGEIHIITYDERLTTASVMKTLSETNMSGRKKRQVVDKMAAACILQRYMDGQRNK
ncbi:MAG: Holliday junction resolvase RuvX [Candidatus Margulisiibacteriota bacterium]